MNKNILIYSVVAALVVGGVVGYAIGGSQNSAQLEKAKKLFPATTMEVRSVFGTVKKVSGNTVTIQTPPSNNPFEDTPTTRNVAVTSKTKITKNEPVDQKVYQEEMVAYQAAMQKLQKSAAPTAGAPAGPAAGAGTNFPTPPMPFKEVTLKVSDIKAGDMVSVNADKNIKTETSFEAVTISVTGTGVGPAAGAAAPVAPAPATGLPPPAAPIKP